MYKKANEAFRGGSGVSTSNPSLHEKLLKGLSDLAYPVYSDELVSYIRAKWGSRHPSVTPGRVERLVQRGLHKFEAEGISPTAASLCPTLTAERGEPILRLIARTDWPLARRIMAPTTGRLRHLHLTARLCEMAIGGGDDFADRGLLLRRAADRARGLSSVSVRYEQYEPEAWFSVARELIGALSSEDERARRAAAERLSAVPNFNLFYGAPDFSKEV